MKFERTLVDERFILEAILGARLSYGSGGKSDTVMHPLDDGTHWLNIGPEDERFIKARLAAGVHGEDKLMRCIPVSVRIHAPLKWWVELDTYKVGTVRQSASLMHRLASRGFFTESDFEWRDSNAPHVRPLLDTLNDLYQKWLDAGKRRHDSQEEWTDWQDIIPRSYIYESQWVANYAVLRNIYFQRKNHRMKLWREFQAWMETLPCSWMIFYEKDKPSKED